MPRGGRREGAGRKPGSFTKRTKEVAEKLMLSGETPLEFMLSLMRSPEADQRVRGQSRRALHAPAIELCRTRRRGWRPGSGDPVG